MKAVPLWYDFASVRLHEEKEELHVISKREPQQLSTNLNLSLEAASPPLLPIWLYFGKGSRSLGSQKSVSLVYAHTKVAVIGIMGAKHPL